MNAIVIIIIVVVVLVIVIIIITIIIIIIIIIIIVIIGTLLYVCGSCERHSELTEERHILLRPIPKVDSLDNWATDRNRQSKLLGTWKVTQPNSLRQKSVKKVSFVSSDLVVMSAKKSVVQI